MAAIKKKKECNAKAQAVVEQLLEPFEDEKRLLGMVREKLCVLNCSDIYSPF